MNDDEDDTPRRAVDVAIGSSDQRVRTPHVFYFNTPAPKSVLLVNPRELAGSHWEYLYAPAPHTRRPGPLYQAHFFIKLPGLNDANEIVYDGPRALLMARYDEIRRAPGPGAQVYVWDDDATLELEAYARELDLVDGYRIMRVPSSGPYLPDRCRIHEDCRAYPALGHECLMARLQDEGP